MGSTQQTTAVNGQFEPVLTIEEVAKVLKMKPEQVYELTRGRCRRPLPFLKVGKFLRFRLSSVDKWLQHGMAA